MSSKSRLDLGEMVRREMTYGPEDMLRRFFDEAKKLVKLRQDGSVYVLEADKLDGKGKLLAYMLGKRYAEVARLCDSHWVVPEELVRELQLVENSVRAWLWELAKGEFIGRRKEGRRSLYSVTDSRIGKVIEEIRRQIKAKERK